jgi:hypothetical protein
MDLSQIALSTPAMSMAISQLKAISEAQMEVAQNLAESQAQMTALMRASGIGHNIDISA